MITHYFVMTQSLRKFINLVIFRVIDIDYNSKTDVFRDVIYLINNQCEPRRLQRTQSVLQPRSACNRIALVADI